jgi:hypothetical protein
MVGLPVEAARSVGLVQISSETSGALGDSVAERVEGIRDRSLLLVQRVKPLRRVAGTSGKLFGCVLEVDVTTTGGEAEASRESGNSDVGDESSDAHDLSAGLSDHLSVVRALVLTRIANNPPYSDRSAIIGSTRMVRRAGIRHATRAAPSSTRDTPRKVDGSVGAVS